MKKLLQIANISSLLFAIFTNYFVNAKKGTLSIGEISAQYDNLFIPEDYAFSIWGVIYAALLIFAVYQLLALFNKKIDSGFVLDIGWWFVLANLANGLWVIAFTNHLIGLSVFIMLILFISLLKIVLNTNMERWDAPVSVIGFIWWPFSLYFGWITVALITNLAVALTALGWSGDPLSPDLWTILVLLLTAFLFVTMIWKRNMREYAVAGVWGIAAIAVKNWTAHPLAAYVATAVCIIILINSSIHSYQNRATAPFRKRIKAIEHN